MSSQTTKESRSMSAHTYVLLPFPTCSTRSYVQGNNMSCVSTRMRKKVGIRAPVSEHTLSVRHAQNTGLRLLPIFQLQHHSLQAKGSFFLWPSFQIYMHDRQPPWVMHGIRSEKSSWNFSFRDDVRVAAIDGWLAIWGS